VSHSGRMSTYPRAEVGRGCKSVEGTRESSAGPPESFGREESRSHPHPPAPARPSPNQTLTLSADCSGTGGQGGSCACTARPAASGRGATPARAGRGRRSRLGASTLGLRVSRNPTPSLSVFCFVIMPYLSLLPDKDPRISSHSIKA